MEARHEIIPFDQASPIRLFMHKLGDRLLKAGPGYFVTRRDSGELTILLYNYEHCNPLFVEEGLGLTPTSRDGIFPNSTTLEISLTLENLSDGTYRVRDTILNQKHGSCFDQWVRMGAEKLGSTETAWLRRNSAPALHLSVAEVTHGVLQYAATLAPHEVRLVELWPIENGYFS